MVCDTYHIRIILNHVVLMVYYFNTFRNRIMNTLLSIKDQLLSPWSFMRLLRLGLGLYVGVQAIQFQDWLAGLVSIFFLYQAITNTGCCGASGCAVPTTSSKTEDTKEVTFEEIKDEKR